MGEQYQDPIYFTSVFVFLGLIQMVAAKDPEQAVYIYSNLHIENKFAVANAVFYFILEPSPTR